jgi:hypothetical protein
MIKWFKNIYDKLYERYLCYYLYIDHRNNIIHISSRKKFSFCIDIPYIKCENRIDLKSYLIMYVNLYGFALIEFDKVIFKELNKNHSFLSLEKIG